MERDVTGWLHKGETVPNLVAGLAYSIALNYLNRVVRGRKIGKVIYFQGGTAYNDAVTAAFASLLGKKITVPPYNGVMGAIGMALIARQWHQATAARALPRVRSAQAAPHHARFRLQGLLEPLRHEGVRHRGAEELLGR
jgi:sugar (pentulose or hexulose) kinase